MEEKSAPLNVDQWRLSHCGCTATKADLAEEIIMKQRHATICKENDICSAVHSLGVNEGIKS